MPKYRTQNDATNLSDDENGNKIIVKDVIADAFLQQILLRPQDYSVIATLNLNGDYISDALAAQVGGIGIAPGANLGDDVLYSGTVAAAIEGRYLGLPAIAVSLVGEKCEHYETAAIIAKNMVQQLQTEPLAPAIILNVNVPDVHYKDIKGYQITRLGTRHSAEPTIKSTDPRGDTIYWIGPAGPAKDAGEGTDFYAVGANQASITPLHIDLTSYESFGQLSSWVRHLSI